MKSDETSLKAMLDFHKAFLNQEFKQNDKEDFGTKYFLNELFLLSEAPTVLPLQSRYDIPPLILGTKPELEYYLHFPSSLTNGCLYHFIRKEIQVLAKAMKLDQLETANIQIFLIKVRASLI